jgi:hypothetical protein
MHNDHVSADHLSDYLRGELDAELEAGVEAHIGSCLVCARQLREEAQLEMLMFEAAETMAPAELGAPRPSRRTLWQRVAATVANSAAAAAALLMVINPEQPLRPAGGSNGAGGSSPVVSTAAFINDSLCFPSSVDESDGGRCEEPLTVAMLTDPDDYLSPFERSLDGLDGLDALEWSRASALNACSVEDLACEPS